MERCQGCDREYTLSWPTSQASTADCMDFRICWECLHLALPWAARQARQEKRDHEDLAQHDPRGMP